MFTQIHLLHNPVKKEAARMRDRWSTEQGYEAHEKIYSLIAEAPDRHGLSDFTKSAGQGLLEFDGDLRGYDITEKEIRLEQDKAFENIDFSYASFRHVVFENATFINVTFNFADFHECKFVNCEFLSVAFYASVFENCFFTGCDFIVNDSVSNCDFRNVKFRENFFPLNVFFDCRFDTQVELDAPRKKPNRMQDSGMSLNPTFLAGIYQGIK